MKLAKRAIIKIDESKCNGCGLCVPSCAEGAIQIIDGKARLVADKFCDGLGACLGECPMGALNVEEREADDFDLDAAMEHMKANGIEPKAHEHSKEAAHTAHSHGGGGCPGSMARTFEKKPATAAADEGYTGSAQSQLGQWPVQLTLVSPSAPYFKDADLLVTADCVPFALADYHKYLAGKAVAVGCPKLDDTAPYVQKLAEIIANNDIKSVTTMIMEVPCCQGMSRVVKAAVALAGSDVPVKEIVVSLQGEVIVER